MTSDVYSYKMRVMKVVDGDTFDGVIRLGFGVSIKKRIRIENIDTPELGQEQHQRAVQATQWLRGLLNMGEVIITTKQDKHDQYGRVLARVLVIEPDGTLIDVGDSLISQGLARPWN